jgi:hypothetical protein
MENQSVIEVKLTLKLHSFSLPAGVSYLEVSHSSIRTKIDGNEKKIGLSR